jgi:hypothetical protein
MNKCILIIALVVAGPALAESDHENHTVPKQVKAAPAHGVNPGEKSEVWYCPMHPQIQQEEAGSCPICSMDLVPMEEDKGSDEVLPESLKGLASVNLSPWKQQLIGMRTEKIEKRHMVKIINTVGRFGGGKNNFATAASGFTAKGRTPGGSARYVIADIYALDIPFVQLGQEAEIRGFSANSRAVHGKVAKIYPYDGTQSRVLRVRIDLDGEQKAEMFANVRIQVKSKRKTALPASAVIDTGSRRYVFVEMEKGKLMPHQVELGFQGEDYWEAIEGVHEGDTVVVGANFMIDADSQLKAVLRGMTAGSSAHQH